jgi:hypothetical protein
MTVEMRGLCQQFCASAVTDFSFTLMTETNRGMCTSNARLTPQSFGLNPIECECSGGFNRSELMDIYRLFAKEFIPLAQQLILDVEQSSP